MTKLRLTAEPAGWLIQLKQPLTADQIADARHRAAAAGITIETRTGPDHTLRQFRNYATGAGVLVALGVLAMTVGLIRSGARRGPAHSRRHRGEGHHPAHAERRDCRRAGAAGRDPRHRRGVPALIAWHWHHISYLNRPPYPNLAVLILGLPAAALVGAWLLGPHPQVSRPSSA